MKAGRLSRRKSLTEGVALSLAEFESESRWGLHECTLDVSCHWYEVIRGRKYRCFAFQPMSFYDD
jgi:hypothetical protein